MSKKVLAVILSLILTFSVVSVPASALDLTEIGNYSIENVFNSFVDKLIAFVLSYLNEYWPGYEDKWATEEEYEPEYFYAGEEVFDDTEGEWSLGYAGASLIEGIDVMSGDYFLGGSLEPIVGRAPKKVYDDQRVRVYAISDGVSGVVVHAVIDGFGFARGDVMEIRSRMAEFAEKYGIISINVSTLHQHSCIDTLGMNVPLAPALIFNTGNAAAGGVIDELKVQKNQEFMENLFNKTVYAMKRAVVNMKEGELSYGYADIGNYIKDKRDPQAIDPRVNRIRFAPEDGSKETWILEAGIHCTGLGAGPDELSADYPYYIEKAINEEANANVVFVLGPELAITSRHIYFCSACDAIPTVEENSKGRYVISCPNDCVAAVSDKDLPDAVDAWNIMHESEKEDLASVKEYGYNIAKKVMAIDNDVALAPILNIKLQEVGLNVTNEILTLAAREDILSSVIVKTSDDYKLVTEIGYMELGGKLGIFLCPGEFDPILVYGGPESGDAAWFDEEWTYAPYKDLVDVEYVMAYAMCNDQAGYVLRDNEYHSLLVENEEVNVISTSAASTFATEYANMLDAIA